MSGVFLEIVLTAADLSASGIEGRDEIEDPVHDALSADGLGEVTGGGAGGGRVIVEVEVFDEQSLEQALSVIRKELVRVGVPEGTIIKRNSPVPKVYRVFD